MDRKIRIVTLGDHPLSPSGVGTQSKYVFDALLKTGKYQIISLGGALQHQDNRPMKFHEFGDDWIIYPVNGYGNEEIVRSVIRNHKPDMLWFMTDPRFYVWLWSIENEIRPLIPMVYYHVWDNYPYPKFNKVFYDSTDSIVTISKVTSDIVKTVAPTVDETYLPHAVNTNIFKRLPEDKRIALKRENFPEHENKMIFFWNNRNARRKQSGTLIFWFKEFLDIVGHDKAMLLMHTDPKDENGQDLYAIINELGMDKEGSCKISNNKIPPEHMAALYSVVDCTINISDAEGFGLGTLESLACETPIIVNMTGGLQEQVTDGKDWFGIGIKPASRAIIGTQPVPYIYEDRLNKEEFIDALLTFYNTPKETRTEWGVKGKEHMMKNYNFDVFCKRWDEIMSSVFEKYGSWENRKNYKSWEMQTL